MQHTSDAVRKFFHKMLKFWNLLNGFQSITTANAAEMVKGIENFRKRLFAHTAASVDYANPKWFHINCMLHVINLWVTASLGIMGFEINKIRKPMAFIISSVRIKNIHTDRRVENGFKTDLPPLDCRTRLSSTFEMICSAYWIRRDLKSVIARIP